MNCQDFKQNIFDYCDGEVSPDLPSAMDEHLNECEDCRSFYHLTLIENEVLCDTGDIPLLSEAFTARVMGSLASVDRYTSKPEPLVMSKSSSTRFKRISLYSGLSVAAAVIALCLYIPNLKDTGNNINVADNSYMQQRSEPQSNAIKNNDYGVQILYDDAMKISQVTPPLNTGSGAQGNLPPSTIGDVSKSIPDQKELAITPSILSAPDSSEAIKRSTTLETGRSKRNESQVYDTSILDFSPQNIPVRFKLTKSDNTAEQETIYNYVSQDGKESFQLKVTPYQEKIIATMPISNIAVTNSPSALTRDVQVGNHKFTLTVSGNIPTEELTQLTNNIQLVLPTENEFNTAIPAEIDTNGNEQ
jgi:hypothetical protein